MTTTKTGLQLLPQYRDVTVIKPDEPAPPGMVTRKQDINSRAYYLVDAVRHERVSTMTGIINKHLDNYIINKTLEPVGAALLNPETPGGLKVLLTEPSDHDEYKKWIDKILETARKSAARHRDEAAERGTSIHESIADALSDPPMKLNDLPFEQTGYALTWITYWAIDVEAVEMTVWDDSLAVAGTCDGVGRNRQGDRIIWDWKTGSGPWWEMALQLGAYAKMIQRLTGERVVDAYILKLTSTGYEPHRVILPLKLAWDKFEAAVHLKRASALKWFD